MAIDMKENSKIINSMVKVQFGSKRILFCVICLFTFKIGKYFESNGDRYEGQFKDNKYNGQGIIG